jgi:hypothetical protein
MGNQVARMNNQMTELERASTAESDPDRRKAFEAQARATAMERDQIQQNRQGSLEREQELAAQLSREQAEIDGIQKELSRIESDFVAIQKDRRTPKSMSERPWKTAL